MQTHEVKITLKVPKLDYFLFGLTGQMLIIGLALINVVHWILTNSTLVFDLSASWIILGFGLYLIFCRYMEGTELQAEREPEPIILDYQPVEREREPGPAAGQQIVAYDQNPFKQPVVRERKPESHQTPEPGDITRMIEEIHQQEKDGIPPGLTPDDNIDKIMDEIGTELKNKKVA